MICWWSLSCTPHIGIIFLDWETASLSLYIYICMYINIFNIYMIKWKNENVSHSVMSDSLRPHVL